MDTIGIIGVGLLGSAIAARLQAAGYTVIGYDLVPGRRIGASTGQEVMDKARTVIFCLPTSDVVAYTTSPSVTMPHCTPPFNPPSPTRVCQRISPCLAASSP